MKFFAKDIEKITSVKRNRLQAWIEKGFVSPSILEAEGHGTRNIWSIIDLYNIAVFKKLTESGLSRTLVAEFIALGAIAPDLMDFELADIDMIAYVKIGKKVEAHPVLGRILNLEKAFARISHTGVDIFPVSDFDFVFLLNFQKIKHGVDEKAKELIKDYWEKRT